MVSSNTNFLEASLFLAILMFFAPHQALSIGGSGARRTAGVGNRVDGDEWMMGQAVDFASIAGGSRGKDNIMAERGLPVGFFGDAIELTDITCDAQLACRRPNRGGRGGSRGDADVRGGGDRFGNATMGTFVCRSFYNPITGEAEEPRALCIENDRAWSTDVCGCCGEDCPSPLEFIDLVCDPETQPTPPESSIETVSRHSWNDENIQVVCRDRYDPFTGALNPTTIPIKSDMALADDDCGCCDGVCPTPGDGRPFERPDTITKSCDAEEFVACEPRRKGEGEMEGTNGFYVCRTMFNPLSGEARSEAKCILEDEAWESDQCGCCGEDCPERRRPSPVDIDCNEPEDACSLRNGMPGVFVCRSIFNPFDGALQPTSLCIPSDKAWETDACGCCLETGCPLAPMEGFPDEESQLMALATGEQVTNENDLAAIEASDESGSPISSLVFGAFGALFTLTGTTLAGML